MRPQQWWSMLAAIAVLAACTRSDAPTQTGDNTSTDAAAADVIYTGGDIITVNDAQPSAEAVAIRDGRILAVGSAAQVLSHRGPGTRVVDLAGKTLLPGFIDAHGHMSSVGMQAASANLLPPPDGEGDSINGLINIARTWATANKAAVDKVGWIIGFGYDDSQLEERRHPTADELDRVSTEVPVLFIHQSGHLAATNHKALALARISATTKDPAGGAIRRKAGTQEPNGVLEEMAMFTVLFSFIGHLESDDLNALLRRGQDLYASFGFTTAQEGRATTANIKSYIEVANAGDLILDVVAFADIQSAAETIQPPYFSRNYTHHFRIGGAKLNLDGSPQGKTAWLTKPYLVPPPGQKSDYRGYPAIADDNAVDELVLKAFSNGWQLLAHCAGDAASDQYINAIRNATVKLGPGDRRPVMIHAHTVRADQLDAMKELGVIPSFFSMHTFYWGDWHRDSVLGAERAANFAPAKWALDRGMRFTQHHDAPVALPNSIMILHTQVNRVTRSGKILGPEQRVPVVDALKSITLNAAYQYFEEKTKGSIEAGKLADLVILDKNPLKVDPMTIRDIKVVETIKDGRVIYRAP